MAEFAWTPDFPAGVMRNRTLSTKLRDAAVPEAKVLQFVDPEPGYGRNKGDTITIPRIRNIAEPTSARIGERDRIPIDAFAHSSTAITVTEWGRGVEYTELTELLAHFEPYDRIQRKLRQQLTLVMDTAAAAAFKTAKITFAPTSLAGGTFETSGTPGTTALVNGTVAHIKVIRDYLADTIHAPGWDGGDSFICLASTKFLRGLKNDPEFLAWRQYAKPDEAFFKGEVGTIENIRFIEINHTQALSNSKGSGGILGEALVFGADAVAMAVAKDPEVLAAIPTDFGRFKAVAWYGVLEFGCIWDTANDGEARIIRVTSA